MQATFTTRGPGSAGPAGPNPVQSALLPLLSVHLFP